MGISVAFTNVTKKYKLYQKAYEKLLDLSLPNGYGKDFFALQNINFEAEQGDIIGIIGVNGAGKSTMSNLIAGVIPPSRGTIKIEGDASLISIAAGLNNQLTGRENIELKCLMLGFSKREIQDLMPKIIEFADIGDFIDQPVKSYSSGMKSRLGFAISVNIDPDILVVDEALSVGDQTFTKKCLEKMNSFKEKGKTIFFISHSIGQVKEFCQKALWLEAGEIKEYGPVEEVVPKYERFIKEFNKMSKEEKKQFNQRIVEKRSKKIEIEDTFTTTRRRSLTRKKTKRMKVILNYLFGAVILLSISLFLYTHWNSLSANFKTDDKEVKAASAKAPQTKKIKKQNPSSEAKQMPDIKTPAIPKDIRYVNVPTGFVRGTPNLSASQKISTLSFGDAIIVEGAQNDPAKGNFTWLKFVSGEGRTGWVSSQLVTKFTNTINENSFIEKASAMTLVNDLPKVIANLDKSAENIGSYLKLNLDINNQTGSQLINQFGPPSLQSRQNAYFYHGINNDYIFYSADSISFDKLTIKPTIK